MNKREKMKPVKNNLISKIHPSEATTPQERGQNSQLITIKVTHITKIYPLYEKPIDRLKEALNPFKKSYHRDFYALKDVSFEIQKGSTVSIIGKNGAGKSTLLKIITGVLTPNEGSVEVNGKIASLLELGAGFNPEMTGMENIFFNGAVMGFTHEQMQQKVQKILEFADIGDFIYQPVKMYSSGMFARLAFSVAINVEPDVLIVDEALSVGDINFQAKCMKKFKQLQESGATILLVTHDMGSVLQFSQQVIFISDGMVRYNGDPKKAVDMYKKVLLDDVKIEPSKTTDKRLLELKNAPWCQHLELSQVYEVYGNKQVTIKDIAVINAEGKIIQKLIAKEASVFKMKIGFNEDVNDPIFTVTIRDLVGKEITGTNTAIEKISTGSYKKGDEVIVSFSQNLNIAGGKYLLTFACSGFKNDKFVVYERLYHIIVLEIISLKNIVGYFDINSTIEFHKVVK